MNTLDNNNTADFFMDGSPKEMGFFAREKPDMIDWGNFQTDVPVWWKDDSEVLVIRSIWFFHAEQKIKLGKLQEFFTTKAILLLEKDDYIKIKK